MGDRALTRQFHATCILLRMQLIRAAQSYDMEECLRTVRSKGMVSQEDETFIRACLAANERLQASEDAVDSASESTGESDPIVSYESVNRIHVIVSSRLNIADSA